MTYIDYCPICRGLGCGACRVGLTEYIANFTVTEEIQPEKDNSTGGDNMEIEVDEGYEPLAKVLIEALMQASRGKGKICHANDNPFLEQQIMIGAREAGEGGLVFQSRKKILEALRCKDDDRAIEDMLGAINYVAAQVLLRREGIK